MVAESEGKEGVWRSVCADGDLVGSISVERKDCDENNAGELGYMILTPWWSKGIGTEAVRQMCGIAFKELGIDCIEASVFEGNRADPPGPHITHLALWKSYFPVRGSV